MNSVNTEYFVIPCDRVANDGYDNQDGDLIVSKDQIIKGPNETYFTILSPLGKGQFGRVYQVLCMSADMEAPVVYAMKITRSQQHFQDQANHEIEIHRRIKDNVAAEDRKYIIDMAMAFEYHNHVCIVTELLSVDLYQVLKYRNYKGLPISLVRNLLKQLLQDLVVLKKVGLIHGDIKPENIMSVTGNNAIKLIDFGSAKTEGNFTDFYFQSRYYRAPEVVLRLPYDYKVDVWSVACVAIEMFIASPIFAGQNEMHLLQLISQFVSPIPISMIRSSPKRRNFFNQDNTLKILNQYCYENGEPVPQFQQYLIYNTIPELIMKYPIPRVNKQGDFLQKEMNRREHFLKLILKMLTIDPKLRPTPEKCLDDPFFTIP